MSLLTNGKPTIPDPPTAAAEALFCNLHTSIEAGLLGFTKALAQEVASHGITVNAIAPGYTDTEMVRAVSEDILKKIISEIPVKRLGKPEEIAGLAFFLASEEAAFITGATLNINGGQFMG